MLPFTWNRYFDRDAAKCLFVVFVVFVAVKCNTANLNSNRSVEVKAKQLTSAYNRVARVLIYAHMHAQGTWEV